MTRLDRVLSLAAILNILTVCFAILSVFLGGKYVWEGLKITVLMAVAMSLIAWIFFRHYVSPEQAKAENKPRPLITTWEYFVTGLMMLSSASLLTITPPEYASLLSYYSF